MSSVYQFDATTIAGESEPLSTHQGKVILIVNTASKCGLTPQFQGLESLYSRYKSQGFVILGFPCNQFAHQDPASNSDIQQFCQLNYGVSFPMYAKIDVNGASTHPLYRYLKQAAPGALGSKAIKWNFTKFLINKQGEVIKRFSPTTTPEKLETAIISALAQ